MKPLMNRLLFAAFISVILAAASAVAQTPTPPIPLTAPLALTSEDGVAMKVPAWRNLRHDSAIAVYEDISEEARDFHLLLITAEPGPKSADAVDWNAVRDNIVKAAAIGEPSLNLKPTGVFKGPEGSVAQTMAGVLTARGQAVQVSVVALLKGGHLVTITILGLPDDPSGPLVAADIARSVTWSK